MRIKEYKNTQKFETAAKAYEYLEYLGGKKTEGYLEGRKTSYYIFGDMILKYEPEYRALYTYNGYPGNIAIKIENSPAKIYFYQNHILNLEGLVYLYALLTSEDKEVEKKYEDTLLEMYTNTLKKESKIHAKIFEKNITENAYKLLNRVPMVPNSVIYFRNSINKLLLLLYPFNSSSFIENANLFIEKVTNYSLVNNYYGQGIELGFNYTYDCGDNTTVECKLYQYQDTIIAYVGIYDKNAKNYENIEYTLNIREENLTYYSSDLKKEHYTIYTKNNILIKNNKSTIATIEDYEEIINTINRFTNKISKDFPYIDFIQENKQK